MLLVLLEVCSLGPIVRLIVPNSTADTANEAQTALARTCGIKREVHEHQDSPASILKPRGDLLCRVCSLVGKLCCRRYGQSACVKKPPHISLISKQWARCTEQGGPVIPDGSDFSTDMSWLLPQLRSSTARLGACKHGLQGLRSGPEIVGRASQLDLLPEGQAACAGSGNQLRQHASDSAPAGKPAEGGEGGETEAAGHSSMSSRHALHK